MFHDITTEKRGGIWIWGGIWIARYGDAMATGRTKEKAIERVTEQVQKFLLKREQREHLESLRREYRLRNPTAFIIRGGVRVAA